jgi:hypothetical protein
VGKVREILLWREGKSIIMSEGSQVSPVRPSDKGSVVELRRYDGWKQWFETGAMRF